MKCVLLAFAFITIGCDVSPARPSQPRTLSSGRVIDVLASNVSASPGEKHLWFDFKSGARSSAELIAGFEEVWRDVQRDADAAGLSLAFVKATDGRRRISREGWKPVRVTWETGCATFRKGTDGVWRRQEVGCCFMGPCHFREWASAG
jgi:hypothetical protein